MDYTRLKMVLSFLAITIVYCFVVSVALDLRPKAIGWAFGATWTNWRPSRTSCETRCCSLKMVYRCNRKSHGSWKFLLFFHVDQGTSHGQNSLVLMHFLLVVCNRTASFLWSLIVPGKSSRFVRWFMAICHLMDLIWQSLHSSTD